MAATQIWGYREHSGYQESSDLVGFRVEATDGRIGKVIHAGNEATLGEYPVVDTGPWIFGKHVVLPAGSVSLIDLNHETVFVDRAKAEINDAPEVEHLTQQPGTDYLDRLGSYDREFYSGGTV